MPAGVGVQPNTGGLAGQRMVSAVERPCLVLLAAYARVRGSQARRTITMRHKALLACRSPPRSSR